MPKKKDVSASACCRRAVRWHLTIRGWTQRTLAKKVGVSTVFLCNLLAGRSHPSINLIDCFAKAFGVSSAAFLEKGHSAYEYLLKPAGKPKSIKKVTRK